MDGAIVSDVPAGDEAEVVVPLIEETAHVAIRDRVRGKVRVTTTTEVVEELARADLRSDSVDVTRVPIGREVTEVPQIRTEGLVTIVPVIEEILVVEKRLFLKEELHIRRSVETETVEVPIELRKQRATVERVSDETDQSHPEENPS
jgi:stress response protein YsnF